VGICRARSSQTLVNIYQTSWRYVKGQQLYIPPPVAISAFHSQLQFFIGERCLIKDDGAMETVGDGN
jgi:hypothetical protein